MSAQPWPASVMLLMIQGPEELRRVSRSHALVSLEPLPTATAYLSNYIHMCPTTASAMPLPEISEFTPLGNSAIN